jgi:hypothetical protein
MGKENKHYNLHSSFLFGSNCPSCLRNYADHEPKCELRDADHRFFGDSRMDWVTTLKRAGFTVTIVGATGAENAASEHDDLRITINGRELTSAQAMVLQAACVAQLDVLMSAGGACGVSKFGEAISDACSDRLAEICAYMLEKDATKC